MRSDKVWSSKTETVDSIRQKCLEKDFELIEVYFEIDKNHGRNQTRISFICNKHIERGIQNALWASIKNAKSCRFCATDKLAKDKTKSVDVVINAFYDNEGRLIYQTNKHLDFYRFYQDNKQSIKREISGSLMMYGRDIYGTQTLVVKYVNSKGKHNLIEFPLVNKRKKDIKLSLQIEDQILLICN